MIAKRNIDAYRPRGLPIDEVFYSESDLDAIIRAVGGLPKGKVEHWRPDATAATHEPVMLDRRKALSERLHSAVRWWHFQMDNQGRPTPSQLAKRFEDIEKKAAGLLEALCTPQGDLDKVPDALRFGTLQACATQDPEEYPGQPASERLATAISGVYRIRRWAIQSKQRNQSKKITTPVGRHAGNKALDGLFQSLMGIYFEVFLRRPRASTAKPGAANEGEPTGPFIRYMRACLLPLMGDKTPSNFAIRERWRRVGKSSRRKI